MQPIGRTAGSSRNEGGPTTGRLSSLGDVVRTALLLLVAVGLSFSVYRALRQKYEERTTGTDVFLHLRSLDGYYRGHLTTVSNWLRPTTQGYVLVPLSAPDWMQQAHVWQQAEANVSARMLPVLVCVDLTCPPDQLPFDAPFKPVLVDHLQYVPAYAAAEAAKKNEVLVLDRNFIVQHTEPRPLTLDATNSFMLAEKP